MSFGRVKVFLIIRQFYDCHSQFIIGRSLEGDVTKRSMSWLRHWSPELFSLHFIHQTSSACAMGRLFLRNWIYSTKRRLWDVYDCLGIWWRRRVFFIVDSPRLWEIDATIKMYSEILSQLRRLINRLASPETEVFNPRQWRKLHKVAWKVFQSHGEFQEEFL